MLKFIDGNKLVKNSVIEHQQHLVRIFLILNSKKTLAGIIGFPIVHVRFWNKRFKKAAIWLESNRAMKKRFQIWPDFKDVFFLLKLYNPLNEQHCPCRNAGYIGDINTGCLQRHFFYFFFPVTQQRSFQTWCTNEFSPR